MNSISWFLKFSLIFNNKSFFRSSNISFSRSLPSLILILLLSIKNSLFRTDNFELDIFFNFIYSLIKLFKLFSSNSSIFWFLLELIFASSSFVTSFFDSPFKMEFKSGVFLIIVFFWMDLLTKVSFFLIESDCSFIILSLILRLSFWSFSSLSLSFLVLSLLLRVSSFSFLIFSAFLVSSILLSISSGFFSIFFFWNIFRYYLFFFF